MSFKKLLETLDDVAGNLFEMFVNKATDTYNEAKNTYKSTSNYSEEELKEMYKKSKKTGKLMEAAAAKQHLKNDFGYDDYQIDILDFED